MLIHKLLSRMGPQDGAVTGGAWEHLFTNAQHSVYFIE